MSAFRRWSIMISAIVIVSFGGCSKGGGLNIFTIEDDKNLGAQTAAEIAADPITYPVLNKTQYASAYAYLNSMRGVILGSGQVTHAADFDWDLNIIKNDTVLNAFCTPGGHIYVYTGLIKYLDKASSLAGVLGHEMAHADRRHSTNQLTKLYGLQTMLDVVLGKRSNVLADMAAQLVVLKFSRNDESEADAYSVKYLCGTPYQADGAADFFNKLVADGNDCNALTGFFSTHPCPDNRIQNIEAKKNDLGCSASITNAQEINDYASFKASLP